MYGKLTSVVRDIEPVMECVHRSGKARLMGQLEEGYMVRCPLHVTRR